MSQAVLAPLGDAEWPPSIAALREGFAGRLNVYRVMARQPALLSAWSGLREHVVNGAALEGWASEVVILRTAHRWGSAYEWAHHLVRGSAKGLAPAEMETLRGGTEGMQPDHALLAMAVDELLDTGRLAPATLDRLTQAHGEPGVLDIMATVGMYTVLAFVANTAEPPIDA